MPKRFNNTLDDEDLDKLFCAMGKKYNFKAKFLKAMAIRESSLNEHAYRFEEKFFDRHLKDKDEWKDRDPNEVSASYGLMQLMYTTAHGLGYRGDGEGLYDPVVNVELGAKYMRKLVDKCKRERWHFDTPFNPMSMALARYNGGSYKIPDEDGWINEGDGENYNPLNHMRKVFKTFRQLLSEEGDCD